MKNLRFLSEGFNYFNVAVPPSKRTTLFYSRLLTYF
jgi:hypothetical protein